MSDELKPCPFCGEVPPPVERVLNFPRDEWQWTIQCCCDMQPASWDEDKEKCISTWNTRAQLSAQVKETADSLHDDAVKLKEAAVRPADADAVDAKPLLSALASAKKALISAERAIKGREHTGFIYSALAEIESAMAQSTEGAKG